MFGKKKGKKEEKKKGKGGTIEDIIPNDVIRTVATLETMKETGMISPYDEVELKRLKTLYPSLF